MMLSHIHNDVEAYLYLAGLLIGTIALALAPFYIWWLFFKRYDIDDMTAKIPGARLRMVMLCFGLGIFGYSLVFAYRQQWALVAGLWLVLGVANAVSNLCYRRFYGARVQAWRKEHRLPSLRETLDPSINYTRRPLIIIAALVAVAGGLFVAGTVFLHDFAIARTLENLATTVAYSAVVVTITFVGAQRELKS